MLFKCFSLCFSQMILSKCIGKSLCTVLSFFFKIFHVACGYPFCVPMNGRCFYIMLSLFSFFHVACGCPFWVSHNGRYFYIRKSKIYGSFSQVKDMVSVFQREKNRFLVLKPGIISSSSWTCLYVFHALLIVIAEMVFW